MIYADAFMDLAAGTADGTTPTAPNMVSNTHGSLVTGYTINGAAAGMTIESPTGMRRYESVVVPGYAAGPNLASKALKYLHTTANFSSVEADFSYSAIGKATCFGLITLGPTNVGASGNIFDLVRFNSAWQGRPCVMQLNNGAGVNPGDYYLNIETTPGNGAGSTTTTHSSSLRVMPGATYWFNLRVDYDWKPGRTANTTNAAYSRGDLALFHPYTGQLLGSAMSTVLRTTDQSGTADKCDLVGNCQVGNGEVQTNAGTSTYFKHVGWDLRYARFPILPRQVVPLSQVMPQLMAVVAGGGATAGYGGWQGGVVSVGF